MRKVIFPVSKTISPGWHEIRVQDTIETEVWHMGHFIETKTDTVEITVSVNVDEPEPGQRGTFTFVDRTFDVVRDDDEEFWGPEGKECFLRFLNWKIREDLEDLAERFGWDLDEKGMPLPGAIVFSKSELESQGKTLMAHIMAELKIFPSVGQARKNGWDKPLTLGDFTVTKKKIRFKVVD